MATQNDKISLTHPNRASVIDFFRAQPRQDFRAPLSSPPAKESDVVQDAFIWFHNIVLTDESDLQDLRASADFFEMVMRMDYPQVADEFRMHCDAMLAC